MGPTNHAVVGCWLKFPSVLRNSRKLEEWIRQLNVGKTPWKPHDSDSVWSKHFTDGEPTVAHCFLELKLIHEKKVS